MQKRRLVLLGLVLSMLPFVSTTVLAFNKGTGLLPAVSPKAVAVTVVIFMAGLAIVLWRWSLVKRAKARSDSSR